MIKNWICLWVSLIFAVIAYSQANSLGSPIEALLHDQQEVAITWRDKVIPVTDTPFNTFPQELLKTSQGLYLFINGSGRLYQISDTAGNIQVHRMDSTIFFGYNFGSFPFVYHDSVYNLGGYGIWRINGQLRVYVPGANSWDIVPLNEEVPVLMQEDNHNMLWYNERAGKLYIAYSIVRNQAVKHSTLNESSFDYTVRYLDLKTKEWKTIGALNDYFKDKIPLIRNLAFTPWGQLIGFGDKLLIIDYANNRLLRMKERAESALRPILFQYPVTNLFYCEDSTLFFGNIASNRLASLPLHRNDFIDAGLPVYAASAPADGILKEWIIGVVIVLLAGFLIWKKRKKNHFALEANGDEPVAEAPVILTPNEENIEPVIAVNITTPISTKPSVHFDEKELQVIQLILNNNRQSLPTTIEEVNVVLGLSKKSNDAQKSNRSNVLKSINTKYSIWQNTTDKLIESKKAETDKRTFTYYIAPDKEAIIANLVSASTVTT